jgi:CheY-like chemotaxis protein
VRTAGIEQQPSPAQTPEGPPSPLRIPLANAVQLAMLGMVAVVVGALAYRRYSVRLHSAALLPRRAYELPPGSPVPPSRSVAACAGKGGPLAGRVLVVHSQQAVRDFAQQVLAGAGAEVLALGRGEDAMVRLDRVQYDAIVISDQLPAGWSGREIYRWLERNHPGAERKFILALADETDAEMQLFLEESRALTISSPFGVSDLLAMTRLAMARSRAQA